MIIEVAWFELRTKLRRVSTLAYFLVLAALAALWIAAAAGAFASANIVFGSDKVFVNAPFAIAQTMTLLGILGVAIIAASMGRAVQQDFEYLSSDFFFTSRLTKRGYLLGRYFGAVLTLLMIFLGVPFGILLGAHWPGVDSSRIGPWSVAAFLQPYFVMLLPNILFLGAIFFFLGALTRRMLPVYIAGVVVLIGYLVAGRLLQDIDNRTVAALVDPIGSTALALLTRYWSAAEKNRLLVPLAAELLWNRMLWLGVGCAIFLAGYARFKLASSPREKKSNAAPEPAAHPGARAGGPMVADIDVSTGAYLRQLPGLVRMNVRETVKNVYFLAVVLAGALFILGNAKVVGSLYGTNTYPVTYQVLEFTSGTFSVFMLIVTAFYAGELVWRERDARMALMADSLPQPTWMPFFGKLFALMAVQAILQAVVMACGVLVQAINGYFEFELSHYLFELFVLELPGYWMLAALALTLHTVVNHKYFAHFLVIVFYVVELMADSFGFELRLYRFASAPHVTYSDLNGYGHFLGPVFTFMLYWAAASVLLLVVARVFWVRGTDTSFRIRWRVARARWSRPLLATTALGTVVLLTTGGYIFYETSVLNPYRNEYARDGLQAEYEKAYKKLEHHVQPKIVAVRVAVDIFPHEQRLTFNGTYTLENKSQEPISQLYVRLPEEAGVRALGGSIPIRPGDARRDLKWLPYSLARPLAPGERMTFTFDLAYEPHGFGNEGASALVVDNGTFVNSTLLPAFGYSSSGELSLDAARRKHGLAPKTHLMPDLDDPVNRQRNYVTGDADWLTFEATVSTSDDQIALAPGYLQREWATGGRRYFEYRMDAPILNFYAFISARYVVARGSWAGGGITVPIEVYYHPAHAYNVQAIIQGTKDSLSYFTQAFSPYQHKQVRILEFPRYASFAQSFPNTIPYSEAIGFIAKVDPNARRDIDYPYYVTAHEVAHQWWAHQVIGANVQGATMLSETLAQYSALMVLKKKYGDARMKRFLKYELDSYLVGRTTDRRGEQALFRNENQGYIHYRKGSLAMYALQDVVGEEAINRALASFIRKTAFRGPPYPTSRDLLAEFRAVTPPRYQYLIADLFESMILFENRAISATSRRLRGKYEVVLDFSTKKERADETGNLEELPMDDWIDVAVLGADDKPLYLEKRRLHSGRGELRIEVDEKPLRAGIDPFVKLIDRQSSDNTVAVALAPVPPGAAGD